jgi:hypothetical protein
MVTYSDRNLAWGRHLRQTHDARIQEEVRLAQDIREAEPNISRSEALKRASKILNAKTRYP